MDFEQSHSQFFSALAELIHATGRAVQELLHNVTFNDKTGNYSIPTNTMNNLQLMKKALDTARTENDKDSYLDGLEDYSLLAYTYVNDQGKTVTMWLLEKDGKRARNKELQDYREEHGEELNPILYTELSGEELERKVNDAWKDGVNYLNGQKVSGANAGILKTSAYVASMKDAMDDAGLMDMTLSLGFGIAAARNKVIIPKKASGTGNTKLTQESINSKLDGYLLNKEHPVGGSKASWFEKALGFNKNNSQQLNSQIIFDKSKAVQTAVTEYGTKYSQIIPIKGVNGKIIDVEFVWIKNNDGIVRLVTSIPTKK